MTKLVGIGKLSQAKDQALGWEGYLDPDEELYWQGRPAGGIRFSIAGLLLSLFGVVFFSFSVFWILMASKSSSGIGGPMEIFPLFGLPFVIIGFYLLVGHWIFDAYRRTRTNYALTNKRAIIAQRVFGKKFHSYPLAKSKPISLVEGALYTVNFDQKIKRGEHSDVTVDIGFRYITDGPAVYKLIRNLQSKLD